MASAISMPTFSWASSVEAPRWGVKDHLGAAEEFVTGHGRLDLEDVKGGASDLAGLDPLEEGGSSMRPPRAQFDDADAGFISAIRAALMRWVVSGVFGMCRVMKSAWATASSTVSQSSTRMVLALLAAR